MKVAIQGYRGSFHDIVARGKFGKKAEILERAEFYKVFQDVKSGEADFGVIAIENSIGGSILENFDSLLRFDLRVIGEVYLRIVHNLIALPGVKIEDIKEVYSHPMAFAQCLDFLMGHPGMKRVQASDTAGAVRLVKDQGLLDAAAIGSRLAAQVYGMEVLASAIETDKNNYTRFLVISREAAYPETANKTTLVMQTEHQPGSLYRCLKCFADQGLNLSKLESRPIVGKTWNYYFYLDIEAGVNAPETGRALECLKPLTSMVKILGSYERGSIIEM